MHTFFLCFGHKVGTDTVHVGLCHDVQYTYFGSLLHAHSVSCVFKTGTYTQCNLSSSHVLQSYKYVC